MSKTEFDQYLALLGGLLRLSASQREEIASELRDHLEERLSELLAQGISRKQAIEMALEEFGDAAGLAGDFAQIFRQQRRRQIMRMTLRTAAGLAVLVALATAFWPHGRPGPAPRQLAAQDAADVPPSLVAPSTGHLAEPKLSQRIDVKLVEVPFTEAIEYLCSTAGLQAYVKSRYLDELGVAMDTPVTLMLQQIPVEMALDLILEQMQLTYVLRDGVILVTTEDDLDNVAEVRVYNCRDLLASNILDMDDEEDVEGEYVGDGGGDDETDEPGRKKRKNRSKSKAGADESGQSHLGVLPRDVLAQLGGGMGMGMGMSGGPLPTSRDEQLMNLIITAVDPDSWEAVGGRGTIAEFDGLIVIRHNPRIHRQVEQVLEMLREASSQQPWAEEEDEDVAPIGPGFGGGGAF